MRFGFNTIRTIIIFCLYNLFIVPEVLAYDPASAESLSALTYVKDASKLAFPLMGIRVCGRINQKVSCKLGTGVALNRREIITAAHVLFVTSKVVDLKDLTLYSVVDKRTISLKNDDGEIFIPNAYNHHKLSGDDNAGTDIALIKLKADEIAADYTLQYQQINLVGDIQAKWDLMTLKKLEESSSIPVFALGWGSRYNPLDPIEPTAQEIYSYGHFACQGFFNQANGNLEVPRVGFYNTQRDRHIYLTGRVEDTTQRCKKNIIQVQDGDSGGPLYIGYPWGGNMSFDLFGIIMSGNKISVYATLIGKSNPYWEEIKERADQTK